MMSEMSEYVEASKKYPDNKDVSRLVLDKRIEDGIIKNLPNASEKQLIRMRDDFYWRYYKEDVKFSYKPEKCIENRINELIIAKKREKKLERILKDESNSRLDKSK